MLKVAELWLLILIEVAYNWLSEFGAETMDLSSEGSVDIVHGFSRGNGADAVFITSLK